jgi:TRAP-type C4-dicarboxylate transport system substrate-binding protein
MRRSLAPSFATFRAIFPATYRAIFPAIFLGLLFAIFFVAIPVRPSAAQELTLRVAAFVPANSPWDMGLKRLAADFERISGGRVRVAFPQSLKGAAESDIIQKLKLGLDGALLTTSGLAQIYPDTLAISMPSVIANDAECTAVLAAVEPLIKNKLASRYAVLAVTRAGWIRLYSKFPIVSPEDLGKLRVSTPQGDELIERLFQSLGSRTVKGDWSSLFLQLSSNAVDVFYTSPVMVSGLWSQFKGKVSYISPMPIAPYIGALVFSKASWDKVPAELKPQLEQAAKKLAEDMTADGARMESDAIASRKNLTIFRRSFLPRSTRPSPGPVPTVVGAANSLRDGSRVRR